MVNKKTMAFVDTISLFCVVALAWLYSEYGELLKKFENEKYSINNTISANETFLIFNRVPKAGTETLMELLEILGQLNNFTAAKDDEDLKKVRYLPEIF